MLLLMPCEVVREGRGEGRLMKLVVIAGETSQDSNCKCREFTLQYNPTGVLK